MKGWLDAVRRSRGGGTPSHEPATQPPPPFPQQPPVNLLPLDGGRAQRWGRWPDLLLCPRPESNHAVRKRACCISRDGTALRVDQANRLLLEDGEGDEAGLAAPREQVVAKLVRSITAGGRADNPQQILLRLARARSHALACGLYVPR